MILFFRKFCLGSYFEKIETHVGTKCGEKEEVPKVPRVVIVKSIQVF